ncbi:MAG TPA: type II toxin-antitoxin system RelE/ParE family toxin, partial [Sedimentisphaerales bacterium]|nr:type II toxin-antitoxin system RelE/ParE family toxin [Sedimentisphaerales bacterium]HRS13373.1 type II toxin-antitoxin system RelE/ParE family toxin [Sedimentisphaerales bacterium]HRV50018.1 type II toxin-antitoxin system RelE/ParE family toxin [Sedimentisphaerales bacterium]
PLAMSLLYLCCAYHVNSRDSTIKKRVRRAIAQAESAPTLSQVENLKKLRGGEQYYRIRVGDYRIGLVLCEDSLIFVRCLHRRDICRYLP